VLLGALANAAPSTNLADLQRAVPCFCGTHRAGAGHAAPSPRRLLAAAQAVRCYRVGATALCAANENLACCRQEQGREFSGCVAGDVFRVCRADRPVNVCCQGG
jgi:hypothetical protein